MREIELRVSTGEFVAVVEIPPFPDQGLPEVVMWGVRTFLRTPEPKEAPGRPVYTEGFAVMSLTPSPGKPS
jgi:hypothetical protein